MKPLPNTPNSTSPTPKLAIPSFQPLEKISQKINITETYDPTSENTLMQIIFENPNPQPYALPTGLVGYLEYP